MSGTNLQPDGDYVYTMAEFETISRMVHAHAGICLPPGKATLVYSRLIKRLRLCGLDSFAAYVALISEDAEERRRAIEALTTNHTKFFRENHHFEHFRDHVRPELVGRALSGGRVRLWSAGSSSGEEVYSLAMTLLGPDRVEAGKLRGKDVLLLASDLAEHVVKAGTHASYPATAADDMPAELARLWTRVDGQKLVMEQAVRELVRFRRLNLLDAWPMRGRFDAIFCRNVMIYFDEPTKELLLTRFADQLATGGFLYIGHSERLLGPAAARFRPVGHTLYQKVAA